MNKMVYGLTLFGFALSPMSASASEEQAIASVGASSCGLWIEARESKEEGLNNFIGSWLQGFLSGMNTQRHFDTRKRMAAIPDSGTLIAYVDKYCRDNPLKTVYQASTRLYDDIQPD
jgi:hypothetical protein